MNDSIQLLLIRMGMDFTIYPIYSMQIQLNALNVADLAEHFGYYQIRFRFKKSPLILDYQLSVVPKHGNNSSGCTTSVEAAKEPLVENSLNGYSSALTITRCSQMAELDDTFHCRLRLAKRLDKMDGPVLVPIQIELWHAHFYKSPLNPGSITASSPPRLDNYKFVSRRHAHVQLWAAQSTHCCRPIHFDCTEPETPVLPITRAGIGAGFFTLTVTVHAAICSFRLARQRQKALVAIDGTTALGEEPVRSVQKQVLSPKLVELHGALLKKLLSCVLSIQLFIHRHQHLLHSPLKLDLVNVPNEIRRLQRELRQSESPVDKLEEHLRDVGTRLSRVFTQLLQLFANTKTLNERLLREFTQQRMRQISEAFLVTEESALGLLRSEAHFYQSTPPQTLLQLFKSKCYLKHCPKLPIFVDGNDASFEEMAIILERKFLPSKSGEQNAISPFISTSNVPVLEISPSAEQSTHLTEDGTSSVRSEESEGKPKGTWPKVCLNLAISSANLERRRMTNPELQVSPASAREVHDRDTDECEIKYTLLNGLRKKMARSMGELSRLRFANSGSLLSSRSSSPPTNSTSVSARESQSNTDTATTSRTDCSSQQIPLLASQRSSSDATLTGGTLATTESIDSDTDSTTERICKQMLEFVHRKESFRRLLRQRCPQHDFCLYSDSFQLERHFGGGSLVDANNILQRRTIYEQAHLVVLVHGLEGTSDDLTPYRNHLRLALPDRNLQFLQSTVNQYTTWTNLERMAENLMDELLEFIERMPVSERPAQISFIAHSLGGLIVRAMCALTEAVPILPKLHTLMTLNSPHCGLLYNQRAANWGLNLFQWWKQSACLEQLMLQDALDLRKTCIYRLSGNSAFAHFKNVLLVGSNLDYYVPCHSALVEQCKQAMQEPQTQQARVYSEMLANINESIVGSPKHTQLVKYTVIHHTLPNVPKLQQVTGRAVHVAAIDNDSLVERLISISAAAYFK